MILDIICCACCRQTNSANEYSNLIENHKLARIVTLITVLAILGLVLTYIIKSALEPATIIPTEAATAEAVSSTHSSSSSVDGSFVIGVTTLPTSLPQLRL